MPHLSLSIVSVVLAGALLLCMAARADAGQARMDSGEIEEITVYGEKPLLGLRWQMQKAEKTFYDAFNELNSDDDFDVKCAYSTNTGSRLAEYECIPRFVRVHQSQLNKQRQFGSAYIPEQKMDITEKRRQMQEELVALIESNPELLKAFTDALDAKKEYQTEREDRCKGGSVLCNGE